MKKGKRGLGNPQRGLPPVAGNVPFKPSPDPTALAGFYFKQRQKQK